MFPCLRELFYKCYSFTTKKKKKEKCLIGTNGDLHSNRFDIISR